MTNNPYIFGIHAVVEALRSDAELDRILIKKDLSGDSCRTLLDLARERQVPVSRVPIERINRITRRNHQGVLAQRAVVSYYKVEQMIPFLFDNGDNPFLVVLDGVTDVRNFGAIARTCDCAGVNAIVIPERGSVSVTADALKTSSGALNHVPVCRQADLIKSLRYLKDCGLKLVATGSRNAVSYVAADYTGPLALVLGAEDKGISAEVMDLCDTQVMIPEFGQINSLNVSVAGGIMMYEVVRQRINDGQLAR